MTDRLTPLSLERHLAWILSEYDRRRSIYGIYEPLFFKPRADDPWRMTRYSVELETPLGVAAGPHTQLAQNIVAAWLCGARYIELKTIQTMDNLEVAKPCIDMPDEGYNCEWSQELRLRQSFEEYLNAWILIHVLRDRLGFGGGPGMIFNMSAGYDLAGIRSANVQDFLNLMEDARTILDEKLSTLARIYPRVRSLDIPRRISNSLTISTMHGCPPDEIEKIGKYFISERGYHTTLKLNPTLAGPEVVRSILNRQLGFHTIHVPDEAFAHDLKWADALVILANLRDAAAEKKVKFSLKLTNTLEVENRKTVFPASESMAYLSGRPLHPISVDLAARLQQAFDGALDISFSAGVDAFNFAAILLCNIKPVTTCSDLLKPGGYTRLGQYLTEASTRFAALGARSIDEAIHNSAGSANVEQAGLENLQDYAASLPGEKRYQCKSGDFETIKTARSLEPFDCIHAPCMEACATNQDIPSYLHHTSTGDFARGGEVVRDTNAMPAVTGYVCDHLCQTKCTRNNLDNPLLIREIKRFLIHRMEDGSRPGIDRPHDHRVAVIGAGPSGLSCAYFMARWGFSVTLFESQEAAGGMVSLGIPSFRLPDAVTELDLATIRALGVEIRFGQHIDGEALVKLKSEYDFVYLSVGAMKTKKLGIPGIALPGVLEPLAFLSAVKQGASLSLGSRIAIIGGGNTAIDAARTARRLGGPDGEVTILYRRSFREMPADHDEVRDAQNEGICLREHVAPLEIRRSGDGLALICGTMVPGAPDASGRDRPVDSGEPPFTLEFDQIIPAIGQEVAGDLFHNPPEPVHSVLDEIRDGVLWYGGDALRGASSVVNAIGDGQLAARRILAASGLSVPDHPAGEQRLSDAEIQVRLARRQFGQEPHDFIRRGTVDFSLVSRTMTEAEARQEAARCLYCDEICNICVSVCPNIANLGYTISPATYAVEEITPGESKPVITPVAEIPFTQTHQVLNIGDFCNECGNCTTFCPTAGRPFKDKPRVFLTAESYAAEPEGYYFDGVHLFRKEGDRECRLHLEGDAFLLESPELSARLDRETLKISRADLHVGFSSASTADAPQMAVLLRHADQIWPPGKADEVWEAKDNPK